MSKSKRVLKERIVHEMYAYFCYFMFFALFFCAFTMYRDLILGEYAISYIHYGYSIVEAMILAKIILIGQTFGLGERFANKPLIVPTIYKVIVFSLFVLAFKVLEHFIVGYFEGREFAKTYQEFIAKGLNENLANILVMIFVFIPFFAFLEIEKVIGEGNLYNLFMRRNKPIDVHLAPRSKEK